MRYIQAKYEHLRNSSMGEEENSHNETEESTVLLSTRFSSPDVDRTAERDRRADFGETCS